MSNCQCLGTQSSPIPQSPKSTDECLCFKTYRKLCSDGPDPCGDTKEIDVSTLVTNTITDSHTYSIRGGGVPEGFSAASIDANGILTVTTDGEGGKEYLIQIDVKTTKDGEEYGVTGLVYICFEDPCKTKECAEGEECNECGDCVNIEADLEV